MSRFTKKNKNPNIPELTILKQTKDTRILYIHSHVSMRAHAHLHITQYKCRKVRKVCLWGEGNTSLENAPPPPPPPHTHTHTSDREAPHMAFSSEAVASCSTVQWALPLIVTVRHSLYHSHYFGRGCTGHFSILITGRHLPLAPDNPPPIKRSQSRGQSRVRFPSFTFMLRLMLLRFTQVNCAAVQLMSTTVPSFACLSLFSYGYSQHTRFDLVKTRGLQSEPFQ